MKSTPPFNGEREPSREQNPRPKALKKEVPTVLVGIRLPEDLLKVLAQLAEIDSTDPQHRLLPDYPWR